MTEQDFVDNLFSLKPTRAELRDGKRMVDDLYRTAVTMDRLGLHVSHDVSSLGRSALLVMNEDSVEFTRFGVYDTEEVEKGWPIQGGSMRTEQPFVLRRFMSYYVDHEASDELLVKAESFRWTYEGQYGLFHPLRKRTGRVDLFPEVDLRAQPVAIVPMEKVLATWNENQKS